MKVKELIEILKKQDPEKIVTVDYTDHTDWWYVCEIKEEDITTSEVYVDPEHRRELGFPEGLEDEDFEVVMITLNENQSITSF